MAGQNCRGQQILHNLIDRVSRGGSLSLSMSPRADGSIPDEQQVAFRDLGAWLDVNGEAIYDTRGWVVHGDGDDSALIDESGSHTRWKLDNCTASDKRYTQSKDGRTLYAMTLGMPTDEVVFESLGTDAGLLKGEIGSVSLINGRETIWRRESGGLVIQPVDEQKKQDAAVVWKIKM